MAKPKGRARQFQNDERIKTDYDPEANAQDSEQNSDSEASQDDNLGTEHYVTVGKSKLREKEGVPLGQQYRGARVDRKTLEQHRDTSEDDDDDLEDGEDYDDPETANLAVDEAAASDSEIDSDNALGESDTERFDGFAFRGSLKNQSHSANAPISRIKKRATAADYMSDSEIDDEDDEKDEDDMDDGLDALVHGGNFDDEVDDDESDQDEGDDASDAEHDDNRSSSGSENNTRAPSGASAAKPHLAALSNRNDVAKGTAIQQQRKAYDALLNLRIRLQKALVAANTFSTLDDGSDSESEPYEAAEEAAVKLLNTISSLRQNFDTSSKAGSKRKRDLSANMSNNEIWERLMEEDEATKRFREDRLEKWSRKVQSVNVATGPRGLASRNKTLIASLHEQLGGPESRLVKRTRVPRSCAPAQAAKKVAEDGSVYDDADFYQLLLKELVDQRTVETDAAQVNAAVSSVMVTAAKEAKTRKAVDRKASKGRKMRFTVHEKLQNFMAPEDRNSWERDAADRLFGTLFGRKMQLNEDESEDETMEGLNAEEEGLRLFRS